MKIQLNGQAREFPREMMISDLLELLGASGQPVVVELDEAAIFPRDYASTAISEGARVEIVALAAGG
jgi:sulfur carrier protein